MTKASKQVLHGKRKLIIGTSDPLYGNNSIRTSKYTLANFFFLNLLEQFKKPANVYFLVLSILQVIKAISISDGQPTILAPLAFVIVVAMIKDFLEDWKRTKSDSEENGLPVMVLRSGQFVKDKSQNLLTGDVVKVARDSFIPADLVVLWSSAVKCDCYLETKNLDGETNLKQKFVDPKVRSITNNSPDLKGILGARLDCEEPNIHLENYTGSIHPQNDKEFALDNSNVVLRGCKLKTTESIIGVVFFTGHYTKIMMNSIKAKPKSSDLEKKLGIQIFLVFGMLVVLCIIAAAMYVTWYTDNKDYIPYLGLGDLSTFGEFWVRLGNWVLIFGNFVPISLMVTIETVKFIQAIFISNDKKMYVAKTDTMVQVQSSNLNEELGQVSYVFSDKTGTLTCNEMIFKKLIVHGQAFGVQYDPRCVQHLPKVSNVDFCDPSFVADLNNPATKNYLKFLAICHGILIEEKENKEIVYNSSSPDEIALTNLARMFEYEYRGTNADNQICVRTKAGDQLYKLFYTLEFTSARKRQSTIFQDTDGSIWLYTKGADNVIFDKVKPSADPEESLRSYLNEFALEGLRTLVLASRKLDPQEFKVWSEKYEAARADQNDKKAKMEALQDEIERNLVIVGATAIEDKLQDEVPQTIAQLKQAGIRVWVLTGDKVETAKTIGFSCNLLQQEMSIHEILHKDPEIIKRNLDEALTQIQTDLASFKTHKRGIVVAGEALTTIMSPDRKELALKLNQVANACEAVLCCRMSPLQKQQVVKLVKDNVTHAKTLAIGDGANDVNMITEAHIGVGIRGVEGQQAARSSDYAVGEFKALRRLIFYYGRESYRKNSVLVLYSFYKNVVLVMPQFWYAILFVNLSGVTLYDAYMYQLINVVYTSVPIMLYAIFDRDAADDDLEYSAQYYFPGIKKLYFNSLIFWQWFSYGCFQSVLIVLICGMHSLQAQSNGIFPGFWSFGVLVFTMTILIPSLKILTFSYSYYFMNIFALTFSNLLFIFTFLILNSVPSNDLYQTFSHAYFNWNSVFIFLLLICVTYHVDNVWFKFQNMVFFKGSSPVNYYSTRKEDTAAPGYQKVPPGQPSVSNSLSTAKSPEALPEHSANARLAANMVVPSGIEKPLPTKDKEKETQIIGSRTKPSDVEPTQGTQTMLGPQTIQTTAEKKPQGHKALVLDNPDLAGSFATNTTNIPSGHRQVSTNLRETTGKELSSDKKTSEGLSQGRTAPDSLKMASGVKQEGPKGAVSKAIQELAWPTHSLDEDWEGDLDNSIQKINAGANKSDLNSAAGRPNSEIATKVGSGLMSLNRRIVPLPMEPTKAEKLSSQIKPKKADNMRTIINQYT